ncbi:MAG TPA: SelB C-terminal domain-containing protein, partial [Bacillales bacterium]|nr:SelB C-terminal domain-containing protein [Bacillales bacterium]
LHTIIHSIEEDIYDRLQEYHSTHSMKAGINKAEILQTMQKRFSKPLLEFVVENGITNGVFSRKGQFVLLSSFTPHIPKSWQKRVENMISEIKNDGLKVRYFNDYLKDAGLPDNLIGDIKKFLEEQGMIVMLDDQFAYHGEVFNEAVEKLRNNTGAEFEVGDAKEVLDLSRKYMIPFLERLDLKGLTKRVENKRVWQ